MASVRSEAIFEAHQFRTADALHLAAALVAVEDRPSGVQFVTFDDRLGDAAEREGFTVLPG